MALAVAALALTPATSVAQVAPPTKPAPAPQAGPPPAHPTAAAGTQPEDPEVKIGRENAAANDKQVKLVKDPAILARVNRIGQEIAAVANTVEIPAWYGNSTIKHFNYTFKVIDDKDVQAFSLPGGFIYVYKGLLDFCHSDDELAGVLGHEITHAAHHHLMKLMHEQNKIQNILLPLLGAAAIASHGNVGGNLMQAFMASNLYMVAKLNTYTVEAEKDADHGSILYLSHTHYNPVGLYTFMMREAQSERDHSYGDLGIYQTHPAGPERVAAAKQLLDELHIAILPTQVDPTLRASVVAVQGDPNLVEIQDRGVPVCRIASGDGKTAAERGRRIAERLDALFDTQLQPFEVHLTPDKSRVTVRGYTVLTVADATAQNKSLTDMVHDVAMAVELINQKTQVYDGL